MYSVNAPFVVVTVVLVCAKAGLDQKQPTASKAAPSVVIFIFIIMNSWLRAAAVSSSEHQPTVRARKLLKGGAKTAGMRSADLSIVSSTTF